MYFTDDSLLPENQDPLIITAAPYGPMWLPGDYPEDIGRVFIIAVVIDFIYQTIVFRWFYPSQALIVAAALAILPYLIFRGLLNRIGQRSHRRAAAQGRGVGRSQ